MNYIKELKSQMVYFMHSINKKGVTMSLNEKTVVELIHIAATSSDTKTLKNLCNNTNMNVRRALARNENIDSFIANKLLYDPVLNVSYLASFHPKITQKRVFDDNLLTTCVKCTIDERKLDCINCPYIK